MRKIFMTVFTVSLLACNETSTETENTLTASAELKANTPSNMYGFTPAYSVSFVMDSAKNTESVLALWKAWKDGDLSNSRSLFADTIAFFMADGTNMSGQTDSIMKGMQEFRSSIKSMEVTVDAVFAVKSTDKDEDWVTIWGVEMPTDMNGKTDTVSLQETWRFNKAGKVDFMFQATRKGMLPPPPTK
ncbi:MAG TPA: nuclear transport factor 2 family protein [Chitinophagaceae bacterium]|nr:nuclear transport factor 2 family protein [Chitinophagaceae bacterium]